MPPGCVALADQRRGPCRRYLGHHPGLGRKRSPPRRHARCLLCRMTARRARPATTACAERTSVTSPAATALGWPPGSLRPNTCWVKSACHISLGWSAWKRTYDERGRLAGAGVTRPWRARVRLIVARDTPMRWCCWRCQPIVSAPRVKTLRGELPAQLDDQLHRGLADRGG